MDIRTDDNILEIGCGVGFAVQAIVPLLSKGKIRAIDKSPAAIRRAVQRNERAVQHGKAEFLQVSLLQLPKTSRRYQKAFCFNINFFWTKTSIAQECEVIRSLLAKGGELYIFYGPMIGKEWEKNLHTAAANLKKEKFHVTKSAYEEQLKCCYLTAIL
jgi:SAM-dependent methyltransferase